MDFDALFGNENTARHAAAFHSKVITFPVRRDVQRVAKFCGHLVDASLRLLDTEGVFSSDSQNQERE